MHIFHNDKWWKHSQHNVEVRHLIRLRDDHRHDSIAEGDAKDEGTGNEAVGQGSLSGREPVLGDLGTYVKVILKQFRPEWYS